MQHQLQKGKVIITGFVLLGLLVSIVPAHVASAATTTSFAPQTDQEMIAYLMGVLAQLQAQVAAQESEGNTPAPAVSKGKPQPNPYYVSVMAKTPERIARDQAVLRGVVEGGSAKTIDAWFEYGTGSSLKTRSKVYISNIGLSSNSNNNSNSSTAKAPTMRVDAIADGGVSFEIATRIEDLKPGTKYSYRFVTEDDKGYRQYSSVYSFSTISKASTNKDDTVPTVDTDYVRDIKSTTAEIGGFINMNETGIGKAFFLYGSNRSLIRDIEDYDDYADIPTAVNGFRNQLVQTNFSSRNVFLYDISGLRSATTYYFRACVEYDDESKGDTVRCGEMESFTTPS